MPYYHTRLLPALCATVKEYDRRMENTFASLGLMPSLVSAVTALGYEEPTPIQREAIPVLLAGRDLLGQAGTGTGKTAAFALPMIERLMAARKVKVTADTKAKASRFPAVPGLVLVPTRELAIQVAEAIHKYGKGSSLTVLPLYGGAPMDQQIRALMRGVSIVVATPGRALDHLRRQTLDLSALQILVLDEADEMLDMGFAEDLDVILSATPATRQTALFAATMPPRISAIAHKHLKQPEKITIAREKRAAGKVPRVRQVAYIVTRPQKMDAFGRVLEFEDPKSAIVFCRTRIEVDQLTDTLKAHGYGAQALHGGMEQRQRDRVMQMFRSGKADMLVATDVAARGLDIEHVSHVFNFDVPNAPDVYVHRIGRTGRAGREGVAVSLVDHRERRFIRNIEQVTKQLIEVLPLPTVSDLRARRLESTRTALAERIIAGGLEGQKAFVLAMAKDFDLVDVAAAAIALAYDQSHEDRDEPEVEAAAPRSRARTHDAASDVDMERMVVLRFGIGRKAGVGPGDLVGAISGEARIESRYLGQIRVGQDAARGGVAAQLAARIMTSMRRASIRGKNVEVRLER